MATPTPKPRPRSSAVPSTAPQASDVSPAWLFRALLITFGVAVILAYGAVCLLVDQGSWQFILHPSHTVDRTPASLGIPYEAVSFDAATTGKPRLTGWWIPGSAQGSPTILFLHDGQGSLSTSLPSLALLHQAGHAIFAIDYRGFGLSEPRHPSEARMAEDSAAALTWITDTRHIPLAEVVPYGSGLGAVLAAQLTSTNIAIPAIILENPDLHTVPSVLADPRARLLPTRLLVQDRFDLPAALNTLQRPRLLLVGGPADLAPQFDRLNTDYFASLPSPKFTAELPPSSAAHQSGVPCPQCPGPAYIATIARFLDTYVPQQPATLNPAVQPALKPAREQP